MVLGPVDLGSRLSALDPSSAMGTRQRLSEWGFQSEWCFRPDR